MASLGLAAVLFLTAAGCGGKGESVDDANVVEAPDANLSGTSSPTTTAPATGTAPAAASSTGTPAKEAVVTATGWGTLKGRVVFGGTPPEQKVLVAQGDKGAKNADVCAKEAIKSERLVVDPETKGVKFALVYIPKPTAVNPDAKAAAMKAQIVFDQEKCVFEPHVLGVMTKAKVEVKSTDPVTHNVDSKLQNTPFNKSVSPGQSFIVDAGLPERRPSQVVCDIHQWMKAWWLVIDNPYITITDAKGNFELKNVPAGTQKVVVWQEAAGQVTPGAGESVNVQPNGETTKDFTIDPGKVQPES